ncbi:MAG TPA: VOC family protein [Thermoanaerobaculia bacterium]
MHVTLFSSEEGVEELRAFLRDTLRLPSFDPGGGWLIFDMPGEIGCHPDGEEKGEKGPSGVELGFACDDMEKTVAELKQRGVEFVRDVEDAGWGLLTRFRMPGGLEADLYEPRYRAPDR